jgi:hypothetical protein
MLEHPGIEISIVLPSSIDTPLWQHAANRTGRALEALHPAYSPELVARTIADCAERPRREVVVGRMGKLMVAQHRILPELTEKALTWYGRWSVLRPEPGAAGAGNLHRPIEDGLAVRGGWQVVGPGRRAGIAVLALAFALPLAWRLFGKRPAA